MKNTYKLITLLLLGVMSCVDDFTDEFVSWRARETIIPTKQFDIGVADTAAQKPDNGITLWTTGFRDLSYQGAMLFKVDCDHAS